MYKPYSSPRAYKNLKIPTQTPPSAQGTWGRARRDARACVLACGNAQTRFQILKKKWPRPEPRRIHFHMLKLKKKTKMAPSGAQTLSFSCAPIKNTKMAPSGAPMDSFSYARSFFFFRARAGGGVEGFGARAPRAPPGAPRTPTPVRVAPRSKRPPKRCASRPSHTFYRKHRRATPPIRTGPRSRRRARRRRTQKKKKNAPPCVSTWNSAGGFPFPSENPRGRKKKKNARGRFPGRRARAFGTAL